MKKLFTILLLLCSGLSVIGQGTPQVPRQVDFANMKLVLSDAAQKEIQKDVNALRSSPDHFQRKLDLTAIYFPIIERIFKEQGVPEDFKYLAIQESGLISDAVSSANAVGYWQFKDFTAREVGLRVDNRVDERKNIAAASRGAATYLRRNNRQFDNWAYALSSYQAGLGGVKRYVEKKYYGAKKMPITKKTHWYLKKYIAHKIAYQDAVGKPHSEGLKLLEYEKGEGKDLDKIAREFKVEDDFLKYYNKWIKYGKVPTDKEYTVLIPVKKNVPSRKLEDDSQEIPTEPVITKKIPTPQKEEVISYPEELKPGIKSGKSVLVKINGVEAVLASTKDNVTSLAAMKGLKEKKFRKFNDMGPGQKVVAGEIYYLGRKKNRSEIGFHVTLENESLWSVSQRFGIKLERLASKNRISIIDEIKPGQVLWLNRTRPAKQPIDYHKLPEKKPEDITAPSTKPTVARSKIPRKEKPISKTEPSEEEVQKDLEVTESVPEVRDDKEELALYNGFVKSGKKHVVLAGETLWSISKQYAIEIDDLMKWNELTKYDVLSIGQELFVKEPRLKKKAEQATKTYEVRAGDTMYKIANDHNMDVSTLMFINNKDTSNIAIGERLKVYKN